MKQRIEKIKNHVRENKESYISLVGGIALGVLAKTLISKEQMQIVDSFKLQVKSPTTNNVVQINLPRLGHPGNIIVCNETGLGFSSQNQAAKMMGINAGDVSKNVRGLIDNAGGYTFSKIGEAK